MTPKIIAVAGKGGTGKTTVCGLIINHLVKAGKTPLLAVDADPNSNLNEVLGIDVEMTLGDIRDNMLKSETTAGMSKQEYAEYMFSSALSEGDHFDMLVMGRTQGQGCYCFVNGVLKSQIEKYLGGYRYMIVDNEAGLEHISRGILPRMDILLLISDSSRRGIQAVGRIAQMIGELKLNPGVVKLIVNRAPGGVADEGVLEEIKKQGLDLIGVLPQDELVYRYDCEGKPSSAVPEDSAVKRAMSDIISKLDL
ncbi:MAG: AAA family ATPase [Clostridiales bacterium]|nr:AAA family ATPase [Clostridiales bacterium]